MSPDNIVIILVVVVVVFIALRLLRSSFRRSVADFTPHVTYVDETLLDLVRTRQMSAAATYYQKHAGSTPEEAEKTIEYLVRHPESLMLLVRLRDGALAPLYMDETLRGHLSGGRHMKAIAYYSDQTGADMREAQIAVYALAVNPDMTFKRPKD
jgi:hypothetical protein